MNPYPGARPFMGDEAPFFTGREAVSNLVATQVRVSPLSVMVARSGVGKSSLLTCRVLPELGTTTSFQYVNSWGGASAERIVTDAAARLTSSRRPHDGDPLVLVLDQFEDVFKSAHDPSGLWDCIAEFVNVKPSPVHVLVTMREEWLGAWVDAFEYLPDALAGVIRLSPLSDKELMRAIVLPTRTEGSVEISDAMGSRVAADVRVVARAFGVPGNGEPALMQLVLHRLWDEATRSDHKIDDAVYERFGGADRIVRSLVWSELGDLRRSTIGFTPLDRLMWAGLSRYLTLAPGIKATVTPESIARVLRLSDCGVLGQAAITKKAGGAGWKYLANIPEARGKPPPRLVAAIERVLSLAAKASFLKSQAEDSAPSTRRYEMTHDFLGYFFQQFAVAYDAWTRRRLRILMWSWAAIVVELYAYFVIRALIPEADQLQVMVALLVGMPLIGGLYIGLTYLLSRLLSVLIVFPVLRLLARGRMPIPKSTARAA